MEIKCTIYIKNSFLKQADTVQNIHWKQNII